MAAVTCERSYIHRHMFPRARTSSPAKWASLAHVGGLTSEGQLHKGKMNESGLPSGRAGKVIGKAGSSENCRFNGARRAERGDSADWRHSRKRERKKKATVDSMRKALIKDFVPEL